MAVLRPILLSAGDELPPGARRHLAQLAAGGLDALLQTLDAAVPEAAATASPLLKLALLLSAAAAGTGRAELEGEAEEDPEPQALLRRRVAASRHQVSGWVLPQSGCDAYAPCIKLPSLSQIVTSPYTLTPALCRRSM